MSDGVKNFIDKIQKGDNAGAGDAFKDALRAKVGDALDGHRKEVASTMYSAVKTPGQPEEINTAKDAATHSDPKPEIADPGVFNRDGTVAPSLASSDVISTTTADTTTADAGVEAPADVSQ
jgi:hypothetical protein